LSSTADRIRAGWRQLENERPPLERLLQRAVAAVHRSSPRFRWAGIYELYPDGILRLGPFVGSPTDHVFIASGSGVCGTALAERRNLTIPDVSKIANRLACSADTRSEIVILVRRDESIFAQIVVDSHELDAFDEATAGAIEEVAAGLARAYESAGTAAPDLVES
jgi:GAF domain-containing protein